MRSARHGRLREFRAWPLAVALAVGCVTNDSQGGPLVHYDTNPVSASPGEQPSASLDAGTAPGLDAGTAPGFDAGTTPGFDAGTTPGFDASAPGPGINTGTKPDAGATSQADAGTTPLPLDCAQPWQKAENYHPAGYDSSDVHGIDANLNKDSCQNCHGEQLTGCAKAPSCNNCHDGGHPDGWRTNCTYCHGAVDNMTGAPPRDINNSIDVASLTFKTHTPHVTKAGHPAYDCDSCHQKPQDLLSPGHMFDDTPGKAEVTFAGGLSKQGSYAGSGSCGNLYCHGNGRTTGSFADSNPKPTCSGCHGSTPAEASGMSGQHSRHLNISDITCTDCHGSVVDGSQNIIGDDLHVDGQVELQMASGVQFANGECNGTCHGTQHGYFGFGFSW